MDNMHALEYILIWIFVSNIFKVYQSLHPTTFTRPSPTLNSIFRFVLGYTQKIFRPSSPHKNCVYTFKRKKMDPFPPFQEHDLDLPIYKALLHVQYLLIVLCSCFTSSLPSKVSWFTMIPCICTLTFLNKLCIL